MVLMKELLQCIHLFVAERVEILGDRVLSLSKIMENAFDLKDSRCVILVGNLEYVSFTTSHISLAVS